MSGYKCDCGGNLFLIQEKTYEEKRRLLPDGRLAKKIEKHDSGVSGASWLVCGDCKKEYDYESCKDERFRKDKERI